MTNPLRIAVLRGGDTAERAISLKTGEAVLGALSEAGHEVRDVILGDALASLRAPAVADADVVFVALHGGSGEDGRVQAVLELSGRPYVGSRPGPSAVAMDKVWTKQIARAVGVPTGPELVFDDGWPAAGAADAILAALGEEVVAKPVGEGSAVGVHLALGAERVRALDHELSGAGGRWMVERYVAGRELTVPLLWDETCPVIEIRPREGFYDYRNKYTPGRTAYDCPADLPAAEALAIADHAQRLYRALHLRDMARVDFRWHPQEGPFLLEANTIPGMTATSLLPMGAAARGIDFVTLCDRLCRVAYERGPDTP